MIFCNECGEAVEDGMRFCSECGAEIIGVAGAQQGAYESLKPPPPPPILSQVPSVSAPTTAPLPDYQPQSPVHVGERIDTAISSVNTGAASGNSRLLVGILGGVAVVAIAVAVYFAFLHDSPTSRLAASLRSAANNGRLVTLSNDDAYSYYFQLKGLDSTNKALKEVGLKVLPQLRQMGDEIFRKKVTVQSEKLIDQDWLRASQVYEWAHSIEPGDKMLEARLKFSQAEIAKTQGKKDEAERAFSAAAQLAPSWALPVNSLGLLRTETKRWAESVPYYQRAIQLEPSWEIPYNNMGSAYLGQKEFATAESWYRRALEINPNWARPHWHLGTIYEVNNNYTEALNEYQTALNLDPNGYSIDITNSQRKIESLQRKLQRY